MFFSCWIIKTDNVLFSTLVSLLSGARNRNDVSLVRQITQRIKQLGHLDNDSLASASVLFGNILASSGDLEEASHLRLEMEQSGIRKKSGLVLDRSQRWNCGKDELCVRLILVQLRIYLAGVSCQRSNPHPRKRTHWTRPQVRFKLDNAWNDGRWNCRIHSQQSQWKIGTCI